MSRHATPIAEIPPVRVRASVSPREAVLGVEGCVPPRNAIWSARAGRGSRKSPSPVIRCRRQRRRTHRLPLPMPTRPSSDRATRRAKRDGYPKTERVDLRPIVAELEALSRHASEALALDEADPHGRVLSAAVERIRLALWTASVVVDEVTPTALARELETSPDTIRYWVRRGHVRSRRDGGRILVDRQSALKHAHRL